MNLPNKDSIHGVVDLARLSDSATAAAYVRTLRLHGQSHASDADAQCVAFGRIACRPRGSSPSGEKSSPAQEFLKAWRAHGTDAPRHVEGGYSAAVVDARTGQVFLAVDRFAAQTLCHARQGSVLSFSDRADCVEGRGTRLDPQAILDYLYFHMIPAPRTIFANVQRLPAAHCLIAGRDGTTLGRYWNPVFSETRPESFATMRERFLDQMKGAVADNIAGASRAGAFMSGGTDSSTVAGMLGAVTGQAPRTYSIGFEAEGYDEMEYARIAARHFKCDHHEYYVTPQDVADALPRIAVHHDQPFGNSSALPSFFCAQMARADGCDRILAGDGGDELFGGNTRYAMQKFLNHYQSVPAAVRRLVEPWCSDDSVLRRIPGLRQATGYVRHSRVPMPHRFEKLNLLMEIGPETILTPELLRQVDPAAPSALMSQVWNDIGQASLINRMLAYDWRFTLADNDLPKVRGATALVGIEVGYPMLSDAVVDFSTQVPPEWKLRGYRLRWFFKEALRGFLPEEIIKKKKHGFGLPFGPWLVKNPRLMSMARQSLSSLAERKVINKAFADELLERRLSLHPGYFGTLVWILMVLDCWMDEHEDCII